MSSVFLKPQVVKVADFGVARVKAQSGVMTAETGTYRWMAPEVCFFIVTLVVECYQLLSSKWHIICHVFILEFSTLVPGGGMSFCL